MYDLFGLKVQDNWAFWVPSLPMFKRAMRRTIHTTYTNECPMRYFNCFASLDDRQRFRICHPSVPGNQQAGVYSGYYGYRNLGF